MENFVLLLDFICHSPTLGTSFCLAFLIRAQI
jgi:hypothetical protein